MPRLRRSWGLARPPLDGPFELNGASPQADGLVLWMPWGGGDPGTNRHVDRVRGLAFTKGGTPVWVADSERGWAMSFDRDNGGYLEAASAVILGTPITMSCRFRLESDLATYRFCTLMGIWDASSASREGIELRIYTQNKTTRGDIILSQYTAGASAHLGYDVGGDMTGIVYHAVAVSRGYGKIWEIHVNGASNSAVNWKHDATNQDVTTIGAEAFNNGHGRYMDGWVADIRYYSVAKTDAQIQQMRTNPWDLIRPLRRWWAVSAAAAPTIAMDTLTLASSTVGLTVLPGLVAVLTDALSLTGSAESLSVLSTVNILLSALTASGSVNAVDIAPGAVSVLLDALSIIGSAKNITVLLGATTIALAALELASSNEALTVSPGAVTTALTALSLASGASSLEILSSVNILLAAMSAAASAESLTIVPGGASALLAALNLTGSPGAVTVTSGAIVVALAALSLAGSAESSSIVPGAIATIMSALTLTCGAGNLAVSPGAVITLLSALSILSQTESLFIRLGSLVYGDVDGLAVSQRSVGAISHSEVIGLIVNMIINGEI